MTDEKFMDSWEWIHQDTDWPKSETEFEGTLRFHIYGRNREDALIRLQQFEAFLEGLAAPGDWDPAHPAMLFVSPQSGWEGRPTAEITNQGETRAYNSPTDLAVSHAGIEFDQAERLRYNAPEGYDPEALAHDVLKGPGEALDEQYERIVDDLEQHGITYPIPKTDDSE